MNHLLIPVHKCVLSHFSHVLTFYDPMDCSPPGSSVYGILQARILEWDFSHSGIKPISPASPALQADSLPTEPPGKPNPYHKVDNFHEKKTEAQRDRFHDEMAE